MRVQVDVAPEFQDIVNAFGRNQVPQIHENELMRLREQEPLDTTTAAKEVTVDGSGFKVKIVSDRQRPSHPTFLFSIRRRHPQRGWGPLVNSRSPPTCRS